MGACGSQPLDHDTTQATDFYLPSGEGSPRLPRCCTGKRVPQPALPSPERGWVPRARARPCASAGRPRQGCRFLRAWHCRPIHRPRPGALAPGPRGQPGKRRSPAPPPGGAGSRLPPLREVAIAARRASGPGRSRSPHGGPPHLRGPGPAPPRPVGADRPRGAGAAARSGRAQPRPPFNPAPSPRRPPPPSATTAPPQPGPDSSPATSSGRFPKLNPFLCQLRAAPPRRQLSSPNFGARRPARRPGGDGGREGAAATSRRGAAAGPADGEDVGFTSRARSADAPRHGVRARHTPPPNPGAHRDTPTSPRSATAATAGGTAAGGGAAKETCHSRRGSARPGPARPRRPDGPARAPPPPPPPPPPPLLQGPAKFLTCSRRRGRESKRAGAAAAAAEAGERGAGQASAEKLPPKQLQAPRSRRCPPRPPSAPAARWLRARVWSRGTFCLGAGERPPPQGSPPPAFPTRASHSSSRLSPLARTPPLRRPLASQSAGGRAAAAPIGLGGGPPPRPMGEGRRCGGGAGVGGGTGGGAAWCGALPLRWAGAGRGRDARPHAREGAPAGPAHSGRLLRAPAPTRARLWADGAAEVRIQAALRPRPWPAPG
ncbi:basic proline-rich protein-like [Bos javanicus]|uniref:basic proline-rich protein-like n=1 Tax=Bos javanicus TaxID=9906 RepID=UPI002AA6C3B3|nr:basic proline-rich protein-like [Bos javanicus]